MYLRAVLKVHQNINNMASQQEDFYTGEDLEAILSALEEDLLEQDTEFTLEIDNIVEEMGKERPSAFQCDLCDKICKTQRGFTRHKNAKHLVKASVEVSKDNTESVQDTQVKEKEAETILHPLYFRKFLEKSVDKLARDECYPPEIMNEFKGYTVGKLEDVNFTYQSIRDVIKNFDGDAEKFYPSFYKCVSQENVFGNLSRNCSLLLGFEVANHVLAHLSNSSYKEDTVDFKADSILFSKKEKSIICYLGGYVFGTLYRRIRYSKLCQNMLNQQCLSILLAGKITTDEHDLDEHWLVDIKNRGGLWKISTF